MALLYGMGFRVAVPWPMPSVIAFSFFGGMFGMLFVLLTRFVNGQNNYLAAEFIFGLIVPTLFIWFIVRPMMGMSIGSAFGWPQTFYVLFYDAAWGIGLGLLMSFFDRSRAQEPQPLSEPRPQQPPQKPPQKPTRQASPDYIRLRKPPSE